MLQCNACTLQFNVQNQGHQVIRSASDVSLATFQHCPRSVAGHYGDYGDTNDKNCRMIQKVLWRRQQGRGSFGSLRTLWLVSFLYRQVNYIITYLFK